MPSRLKLIYYKTRLPLRDRGRLDDLIIVAGMGRSGTTWAGNIINYDNSYRVLFEPFFPAKASEAKGFEYIQYLNPHYRNEVLANQARAILTGDVRNDWVDRGNDRLLYRRRIVKDIRCNLMLGWLKRLANNPPVVFVIRHPLQVLHSWLELGWGKEAIGSRSDFDIITSQKELSNDFPIIKDVMGLIDRQDLFETLLFEWCVYHLVPFRHLSKNDAYPLFYEKLLTNPTNEVGSLFRYLNKPIDADASHKSILASSGTNFLDRDYGRDQARLLNSWKDDFSASQIRRADYILSAFGLNGIYDKNGLPTDTQLFGDHS